MCKMSDSQSHVVSLDAAKLTFEQFHDVCLSTNRPALIQNAARCFVLHKAAGDHFGVNSSQMVEPFTDVLTARGLTALFGDLAEKRCPAYHCPTLDENDDPSFQATTECVDVTVRDVFTSWVMSEALSLPFHHPDRLYLMNWHFQDEAEAALLKAHCTGPPFVAGDALYQIPEFLGFDLMHAYHLYCQQPATELDATLNTEKKGTPPIPFGDGRADYRFVYIGVEGTWTPLHHDVFGSFSWSLNLSGTKLWYFLTEESQKMAETLWGPGGGSPPPDIRVVANLAFDTVLQREGELVFVPSRWYHQVHNVEGAAYPVEPNEPCTAAAAAPKVVCSVNHNWMSFEQLGTMVRLFHDEVFALVRLTDDETRRAFSDDEWREIVDRMLLGSGAWNVSILRSFVTFAKNLLNELAAGGNTAPLSTLSASQQWRHLCNGQDLALHARQCYVQWCAEIAVAESLLDECERALVTN